MSTKIYTGKILPAMTAFELVKFCEPLQKKMDKAVVKSAHRVFYNIAIHEFDERQFGLSENKELLGSFSMNSLHESTKKAYWSTKTEAIFFPLPDKTLAIFYGDREFEAIWEKHKGVKDYHYQNQVDAPDEKEVSRKEWKQRRLDWDKVLVGPKKSGIPCEDGLAFTFTGDNIYMFVGMHEPKEEILKELAPTIEQRAKYIAERIVDKGVNGKPSEVMNYLTSAARKEKIAAALPDILKEIKPITLRILFPNRYKGESNAE